VSWRDSARRAPHTMPREVMSMPAKKAASKATKSASKATKATKTTKGGKK